MNTIEWIYTTAARIKCESCGEWIYTRLRRRGTGQHSFPPECPHCDAPTPKDTDE